jgi:hypothetical protein
MGAPKIEAFLTHLAIKIRVLMPEMREGIGYISEEVIAILGSAEKSLNIPRMAVPKPSFNGLGHAPITAIAWRQRRLIGSGWVSTKGGIHHDKLPILRLLS